MHGPQQIRRRLAAGDLQEAPGVFRQVQDVMLGIDQQGRRRQRSSSLKCSSPQDTARCARPVALGGVAVTFSTARPRACASLACSSSVRASVLVRPAPATAGRAAGA